MAGETVPVLSVTNLRKTFRTRRRAPVVAVDDISFAVNPGECMAIVGESGSGKSTAARCLLRLIEPDSGSVQFQGQELTGLTGRQLTPIRRHVQMVFQDPFASLHPRRTVGDLVADPWRIHQDVVPRSRRPDRVRELLVKVGLPEEFARLYPVRLSGGQRQRVAIARALASEPEVLVLDEPVSALDVSIQAQVIVLLKELQEEYGMAYVFISHDLALVRLIADHVAVMHQGSFVETGAVSQIFGRPQHPYTRTLLDSSPAIAQPVSPPRT